MIKITCHGKGLIPRVGMIAPVLTPFKVNLQTLTLIIKTPGSLLKPHFVNPETLKEIPLTNDNYRKLYDQYHNYQSTADINAGECDCIIPCETCDCKSDDNNAGSIDIINQPEDVIEDFDKDIVVPVISKEDEEVVDTSVDNITPVVEPSKEVNNNNYNNNYNKNYNHNRKNKK